MFAIAMMLRSLPAAAPTPMKRPARSDARHRGIPRSEGVRGGFGAEVEIQGIAWTAVGVGDGVEVVAVGELDADTRGLVWGQAPSNSTRAIMTTPPRIR